MYNKLSIRLVLLITAGLPLITAGCASTGAQHRQSTPLDEDRSNASFGLQLVSNILPRLHISAKSVHYCEDSLWVYMARYAKLTGNQSLMDRLAGQFSNMLTDSGKELISMERHVDHNIFGIVPLELYIQTKDTRYLDMGKMLADRQWEFPDAEGLTDQTRFWIDDMYMITILQVEAFRATGNPVYLDRAALEMSAYLRKLQQPGGLFYHALEVPFYWGRGNGWAAAGMTELLAILPKDHPRYDSIMQAYLRMMSALLVYQAPDGMWRQLIDRSESFEESSGTAMFTFAMTRGAKSGWLKDQAYYQAAQMGWSALVSRTDPYGNLSGVCVGTNKLNDLNYYLTRPARSGDAHGQLALLWCLVARLE
jgi:rhamnogalacturonyl hydrolase YesR